MFITNSDYNSMDDNKTEELFSTNNYDKKNITNKSDIVITDEQLIKIEAGCNIEDLLELNVPIYKYKTQITLHGLFPDLNTNNIGGRYRNVFKNENKSIGIKYNAIDVDKKIMIMNAIKLGGIDGLKYNINSTEFALYMISENFTEPDVLKTFIELKDKVEKLTFSYNQIFKANIYGVTILVLKMAISSIYLKNMDELISVVSSFKNIKEVQDKQQEIKIKERKEYAEFDERLKKSREDKDKKNLAKYNEYTSTLQKADKFEDGIFITHSDNHMKIVYKISSGKVWMNVESEYLDNRDLFILNKRNKKNVLSKPGVNRLLRLIKEGLVYKYEGEVK